MMRFVHCPGCGALFPDTDGPTHKYMIASSGCWEAFNACLVKEYEDAAYWVAHQNTVDAYAVQHPQNPDPRNVQSVHLHLVSIYLRLVLEKENDMAKRVKAALSKDMKRKYDPIVLPDDLGAHDVHHLLDSEDASTHVARAQEWAESVWNAWAHYHDKIATLAEPYLT